VSLTPQSLLDRLQRQPTPVDWQRLHDLYQPLVARWLARVPGLGDEVRDLTQEVLLVVHRELPQFERLGAGSFRAWLRAIAVNQVRAYCRKRRPLAGLGSDGTEDFLARLEDPHSDLSRQWDEDHDRHVLERLLRLAEPDFSPQTWEAFRRFAIDARPAAMVAAELGLTENAVLQAKSRVLRRLREEAGGLID
jgi:RNA polymerase sigma-70 factor (ECF subfamily)